MSTEGAAPPVPSGPTAALVYQLREINLKTRAASIWWLTIFPTHLALADAPGAQPYVILREQMMKSVTLMEGLRTHLVLKEPRKVDLTLTSEATKALEEWIGRPSLASFYLNQRYRMLWPWALIWIIGSPMLISVPGGPPLRFDPIPLILGLVLFGLWGIAKWRPHPVLFLLDAIWLLCVAARVSSYVVEYHRSKGWLLIVALLICGAVYGAKHFVRFRKTVIAPLGSRP